jgi:hypothetical protein
MNEPPVSPPKQETEVIFFSFQKKNVKNVKNVEEIFLTA